jgi:hypothetical protein
VRGCTGRATARREGSRQPATILPACLQSPERETATPPSTGVTTTVGGCRGTNLVPFPRTTTQATAEGVIGGRHATVRRPPPTRATVGAPSPAPSSDGRRARAPWRCAPIVIRERRAESCGTYVQPIKLRRPSACAARMCIGACSALADAIRERLRARRPFCHTPAGIRSAHLQLRVYGDALSAADRESSSSLKTCLEGSAASSRGPSVVSLNSHPRVGR